MTGEDALPGLEDAENVGSAGRPRGATERAVRDALKAASLDDRDKGAGELAAQCARAVDLSIGRRDPYAVAATARELRETLTRLKLDPVAREGADAGEVQSWLEQLGKPTA